MLDQAYGATKASFRSVGKENQIVIDGTICSSDWVDEKGNCLFDRKTLALTLEADGKPEKFDILMILFMLQIIYQEQLVQLLKWGLTKNAL